MGSGGGRFGARFLANCLGLVRAVEELDARRDDLRPRVLPTVLLPAVGAERALDAYQATLREVLGGSGTPEHTETAL